MPSKTAPPLVYGAASVNSKAKVLSTPESLTELWSTLHSAGFKNVDTAQLYGDSEELLSKGGVASTGLVVDTKAPGGFVPGTLDPVKLEADARRSSKLLGPIDIFYIHSPDRSGTNPIEQTLEILNRLHAEGLFSRLGLSNFSAAEVEQAHSVAKARGWVVPSVYQGNYNAFARRADDELFPTLRRLGFAFYAYSPLAGGFLARRSAAELLGPDGGRFAKNGERSFAMYQGLYSDRPKLLAAIERWAAAADAEPGCDSPAELGYRWVAFNSALDAALGDKVIVGASRLAQLTQVAEWLAKGPVSDATVKAIDAIWADIKDEAPLDNLSG